jgi:hypothetical protein
MSMARSSGGPVGTWAGAIDTVLVMITTALVALGYFDGLRGPQLRLTFEATEPWCRQGQDRGMRHGPVGPGRGREPGRWPGVEVSWPADQRNHQRRGAARCGSGAAVLGCRANDPVLIAEATLMEALLGN